MTRSAFEAASKAQAAANVSFKGVSDVLEIRTEGSLAYMVSHLSVTGTSGDGSETIKREGHTLTVFRKVRDRWLLSRDANLLTEL